MKQPILVRFDGTGASSQSLSPDSYHQTSSLNPERAFAAFGTISGLLLNIAPKSEASSFVATAMVFLNGKLHLIGNCLLFFPQTISLRGSQGQSRDTYFTWREFTVECGKPTTILPSRSSYEKLIELLGKADAVHTLEEIGDVSAMRARNSAGAKLSNQIRHPELVRLLSVDTEAFLSYATLHSLLQQSGSTQTVAPQSVSAGITLGDRDQIIDFSFENHERKGRQPINAIIGPNGTGKTRVLAALAQQLNPTEYQWPHQVLVYAQDVASLRELGVHRSPRTKVRRVAEPWIRATRMLDDVSARCLQGSASMEVVSRLIEGVIDVDRLFVPLNPETVMFSDKYVVRHLGVDYIAFGFYLHLLVSGRPLLLDHGKCTLSSDLNGHLHRPSSGEATILTLILSIFLEATQSSLVLIDEPETNLHPRFISLLMKTVHDMLLATNSLAVVATHSPFVVRELDKNVVTILKATEDGTSVFFPTLQTHGSNVSEITSYVFDDDESSKGYETIIESISSRLTLSRQDTVAMAAELFGTDGVSFSLTRGR